MRNIIRTKAVELSVIPAIAYKQKIEEGSAIKILRLDKNESAVCSIDKRTGETLPFGKVDKSLFPAEAFDEAIEMTCGAPYTARGNINIDVSKYEPPAEDVLPEEKTDMVNSEEYIAIVERYKDERGRMNYTLMNKDFIQFAAKSKVVSEMLSNKAGVEEIVLFIVKSRATVIAGKKQSVDDNEVSALIETLDEIDPRSAFKELKDWIKKQLSR
ncbi:MAG: hypothetical protein FWF94_07975 [Oscillospiraceae bacterium]|nr:hypothetical protein [Oscillospiraceae bacterium]